MFSRLIGLQATIELISRVWHKKTFYHGVILLKFKIYFPFFLEPAPQSNRYFPSFNTVSSYDCAKFIYTLHKYFHKDFK